MIPAAEEIIAGYRFARQRWRLSADLSEVAVRAAVEDALAFAEGDPDAEAAALFFAFARRPRAFPGAWRLMPALLAMNQLRAVGRTLTVDTRELNGLLLRIASREMGFPEVRAWFAQRTGPRA